MSNYIKSGHNTQLILHCKGDGSELFEHNLPLPHMYTRTYEAYTLIYYLTGYFGTKKSLELLNDLIARFIFTIEITDADAKPVISSKSYEVKEFQNLKSLPGKTFRENRTHAGIDPIFIAIKYQFIEPYIREQGEGKMVSYSLVEDWAFRHFVDKAKDRSTLRAKCRSIWNWYDNRDWSIPNSRERKTKTQGELMATRSEHMKAINEKRKSKTKKKILNVITGLYADEYKKKSGSWHLGKIAKATGVSEKTVRKYMREEQLI